MIGPESVLLGGRTAVVTGAAVGLGEAVALALARLGAALALCDRDEAGLERTAEAARVLGAPVVTGTLDVRDDEAVDRFLTGPVAEAGGGRVEVLVNNAGGTFEAPFLDVSPKGQDALVRENFTSVCSFVRATVPLMTDGGSIVNVTSIEAHRAGPGFAVYSAMKAAVVNLTMSLALELGDRRIRVNCVAPDVIPTPGVGEIEARTPLARRGHPDDVAGAVVYLAGDLSSFVTGTTIHVDGGNWAAGGWHRQPDGSFRP